MQGKAIERVKEFWGWCKDARREEGEEGGRRGRGRERRWVWGLGDFRMVGG